MTALDKFFASTNYKITQLQITQEIEFIGKILLTGLEIVAIFFFFYHFFQNLEQEVTSFYFT